MTDLGFRLHWLDQREAAPGRKPPPHHSDHATREEAEQARRQFRDVPEVLSHITAKPAPKVSAKARKLRQHAVEV